MPMIPANAGARVDVPLDTVDAFCKKWGVIEFALFGSVLRDDFGPASDVDVLLTFEPDASIGWQDWLDMEAELKALFGRDVDLVDKRQLRNPYRRHAILSTKRVIYDRRAG